MTEHPAIVILLRAFSAFLARGGDVQAGYIAYSLLLAIFPFLIFSVALTGWVIGDERSAEAVGVLFQFAPKYLAEVLRPVLAEVLLHDHGLFTVFIVLSLWAAMRAVEAINRAFDGIYGETPTRVWAKRKIKSLITVLVSAMAAIILGLLILLAPSILGLVENYTDWGIPHNITFLRYLVGTVVFYVLMWSLHWFLPNQHARGYYRWPGALFSTIAWLIMATGLSYYLAYSGTYSITYGTLAGAVITMLFLYFSGAIILFGAELNAAITRYSNG